MIEIKETCGNIRKPIIKESYVEAYFYTTKKNNDDSFKQQGWRVKFIDGAFEKLNH